MIVSHRHRFIYLRTEKTGSTALEEALASALEAEGEDWRAALQTPMSRRLPRGHGTLRRWFPYFFGLHRHATAWQVRAVLRPAVFDTYFKFAVERNPWDRQVSLYFHRRSRQQGDGLDFDAAMRSPLYGFAHYNRLNNWSVYAIGDRIVADEVIPYERLAERVPALFARLGLPVRSLERRNEAVSGARGHYSQFYTPASRERVGRWYRREIDAFGYTFEEQPGPPRVGHMRDASTQILPHPAS